MKSNVTDALTAAGWTASSVGLGIGTWFTQNWLAALSGLGIVITIYFQYRRDRRQERRLKLQELPLDDDDD